VPRQVAILSAKDLELMGIGIQSGATRSKTFCRGLFIYIYACHLSLDRAHLVKIACTWSYSKSKYFARRKRQPRGFSTDFISKSRQVTLLMKLNYIYELCIHSINYYVHVQTHFILFKSDSHKVQYYFFLKQLGYRIFLNSK
jgi:hypothetical protein